MFTKILGMGLKQAKNRMTITFPVTKYTLINKSSLLRNIRKVNSYSLSLCQHSLGVATFC